MNWFPLTSPDQLDAVDAASEDSPIMLFKHSTRCSISSAALGRLERAWTTGDDAAHKVYFLDLLRYRQLSDHIAQRYGVEHASPQLLVIRQRRCSYVVSHFAINYSDTIDALTE